MALGFKCGRNIPECAPDVHRLLGGGTFDDPSGEPKKTALYNNYAMRMLRVYEMLSRSVTDRAIKHIKGRCEPKCRKRLRQDIHQRIESVPHKPERYSNACRFSLGVTWLGTWKPQQVVYCLLLLHWCRLHRLHGLFVCLNKSSNKTNNEERDKVVIYPLPLLRHSSRVQMRACPRARRLISSGSRNLCLLPPLLPACITPVHVSHTRKISRRILRLSGLYVDHHSINEHRTPCSQLWSWQNVQRRLCGLPQTSKSSVYILHSVYTPITIHSANMHVLCHRGRT